MSDEQEKITYAPFPWFGGKSLAASIIWPRLGDVKHYVEPFGGSCGVLLNRPQSHVGGTEVINDLDCYLQNFWRCIQQNPAKLAEHTTGPASELDLIARHNWLLSRDEFRAKMVQDPFYCDYQIAGWWIWGISQWIGGGWCEIGASTKKKLPDLVNGRGIFRKDLKTIDERIAYFEAVKARLEWVRVTCGDWTRVTTNSALRQCPTHKGVTGVLLDPEYQDGDAKYGSGSNKISSTVREWAIENGERPQLRIALCGFEGEHQMPSSWECVEWKSTGGFARRRSTNENCKRERIWFSPHCLKVAPTVEVTI